MIKKWLILISIILVYNTSASLLTDSKYYTSLKKSIVTERSQVLNFFSFYCSHCYQLEKTLDVFHKLQKVLPKNTKIKKYHVSFLGPLGQDLTQAWALAITLKIENKILLPMFEAVQKTKTIRNTSDIRNIFIHVGIKAEDYDKAWNSFTVKRLVIQQNQAVEAFKPRGIPAIFVNGKYQVNLERMDSNINIFMYQLVNTIKYLIEKEFYIAY